MKGEPDGNFFRINHAVIESADFKGMKLSSKVLYMFLCHLRNRYGTNEGVFFRSDRDLSRDSGLSRPTIISAREELLKKGFIELPEKDHSREATYYKIYDPQVNNEESDNEWE